MKEVFEGKTVSVVGNARSLFDSKYGKEIDTAEIVCRIKRGFFMLKPQDLVSHGNRTDVWFLNWFKTMNPNRMTSKTCDHIVEILHHPAIDAEWLKADLGHHRPSTGLRILHLISLYNPKTVNVYGFDWKKTPSFHDKKMIDERHNFALEEDYCHRRFFEKQKEVFKLKK
jgi:hypothetical protein|tara:strand:- start:3434 stop:3943 length:510 start_codon:yes stop_codon:yes gene_type:complete